MVVVLLSNSVYNRKIMKILHTSDWHIGRTLYRRKRYDEFEAFLSWLAQTIEDEQIDALLVAGDIFDTTTPSNRSQELYYNFLRRVVASSCRHVVVIAGNHDSPSFLNAPKGLLHAMNVHVVGAVTENYEDEVLTLKNEKGEAELVVCAVPYLRDRDIRVVEAGETVEDKERKLIKGIKKHYLQVCELAAYKSKMAKSGDRIPIMAMGHLFTIRGTTIDGDGVRELYVGSLASVPWEIFPDYIDYVALGHLHVPQKVGQSEHIRYSGSPIPMGYGEAYQEKKIVKIEFDHNEIGYREPSGFNMTIGHRRTGTKISEITVPCFQTLERIEGDLVHIKKRIRELKSQKSNCWLEIEYTGNEIIGNLTEAIDEEVLCGTMEILRIKNRPAFNQAMSRANCDETLDELDLNDVFIRCLDAFKVPDIEHPSLIASYKEILACTNEPENI